MKISEAKYKANKKWNAANLKRITLDVRPETKETWLKYAKDQDLSLATFIKSAVDEKIQDLASNS